FQSQTSPFKKNGPMIFIANYWTETSPRDIHVYTNTDEVRIYINKKRTYTKRPDKVDHISSPIVIFPEVDWEPGELMVEGIINGEVAVVDKVITPKEPEQLKVMFETSGINQLKANGSDMIM